MIIYRSLCIYIYVCVCVNIYRSSCIYTSEYVCDYIQITLYTYRTFCVYTCEYIQITLYINRSSYIYTHMWLYTNHPVYTQITLYIYTCVYVCDYIHITLYIYRSSCIYEVCSKSVRIGIVVVVHRVGCVCSQSWHVRSCLSNSWHKLQVAAFAQLAEVGRGSNVRLCHSDFYDVWKYRTTHLHQALF